MSKNNNTINGTVYNVCHVWAYLDRDKKIIDSIDEWYLLGDIDAEAAINKVTSNYKAGVDYDYNNYGDNAYVIEIAKDGDDYIVTNAAYNLHNFRLTSEMMNVMFEALKEMHTAFMFECGDDYDNKVDEYIKHKYDELGTLGFAKFLLSLSNCGLADCYCWDDWIDFDCIKENKKAFGLSDYNINVFNDNKLDEYPLTLNGNICYDIRIRGCGDVMEFIDKAWISMRMLVYVLSALEFHKHKAVA